MFFEGFVSGMFRIYEMGAEPSRCSGHITITPWLATLPASEEYAFLVPPKPWEKIRTGHLVDLVFGGSSGAFLREGIDM